VIVLSTICRGDRWPLCPCGARCRPINCWSGGYWLCDGCGHRHEDQPRVLQDNDLRDCEGALRRMIGHYMQHALEAKPKER